MTQWFKDHIAWPYMTARAHPLAPRPLPRLHSLRMRRQPRFRRLPFCARASQRRRRGARAQPAERKHMGDVTGLAHEQVMYWFNSRRSHSWIKARRGGDARPLGPCSPRGGD